MQFALYNSTRQEAEPKLKGLCLHCGNEVIAKCGSKNVWHWAHLKTANCDAWSEPETQWHRDWKNLFGAERSEIRVQKNHVYHIADVINKNGIVFEFQNSPISAEIIKKREGFYGEKMIWLINGISFKENFNMYDEEFIKTWKFKVLDEFSAVNYKEGSHALIIEAWQIQVEKVKDFLKAQEFDYNATDKIFFLDLAKNKYSNREQVISRLYSKLLDLYNSNKPKDLSMKVEFLWEHYRRCWLEAKRPVFIDFGDDTVFYVTSEIGKKSGTGIKILKTAFLEKYC